MRERENEKERETEREKKKEKKREREREIEREKKRIDLKQVNQQEEEENIIRKDCQTASDEVQTSLQYDGLQSCSS